MANTKKAEQTEIKMVNPAGIGIQIDDGTQRVPITNLFGQEIGVFFFRPTDIGIMERYEAMKTRFPEVIKPLEDVSIGPDGNPADVTDEASMRAVAEARERLYALVDELFDGNFAAAFFGRMNPFSPVGGKFYCEQALNVVGDYIEQEFNRETEEMRRNTEKYTAGY